MINNVEVKLTKREKQIAGLAFCGKAKKEIAYLLEIAYGTVNVILDRVYKKTGTSKLNELGAWWANREYNLNIDFEQLQKTITTMIIIGFVFCNLNSDIMSPMARRRCSRTRRARTEEEIGRAHI